MKRILATCAAILLALTLAGCGRDDPEPRFAPTPTEITSSPSPASPATSPTQEPVALTPEQTVRAWVEAQNTALLSGNTGPLRKLGAPNCTGCEDFIEPIEQVYAKGGRFETTGWVLDAARQREEPGKAVVVDAGVIIPGGRTFANASAPPVKYAKDHRILKFRLSKHNAQLTVSFVGFIS